MTPFPFVEACRRELQATHYTRLSDAELADVRRRYAEAHHSSATEGIHPSAEQTAFYAMLLEERVPQHLANHYSRRFLQERIVAPALARQEQDTGAVAAA